MGSIKKTNPHNIVFAVVCYNNEEEVIEFCKSALAYDINGIVVSVTINASNNLDFLIDNLEGYNDKISLSFPHKNMGYLHGCLYGINNNSSNNIIDNADWIIISNTDVKFNAEEIINGISCWDSKKHSIACIAPNIRLSNGCFQNPFLLKRISRKKVEFMKITHKNRLLFWLHSLIADVNKNNGQTYPDCENIYAPHGSFMIINSQFIRKMLSNNDGIFMFGEELLIGELAIETDMKIVYDDSIHVLHMENATTKLVGNKNKIKWYTDSYSYLLKRFYFG